MISLKKSRKAIEVALLGKNFIHTSQSHDHMVHVIKIDRLTGQ